MQECLDDWDMTAPERDHRHVSHLHALYPSNQINRNTPELLAAPPTPLDPLLVVPGRHDLNMTALADAIDLHQVLGGLLDHIEDLNAESIDPPPGEAAADPVDEPAAEALPHALGYLRESGSQNDGAEHGSDTNKPGGVRAWRNSICTSAEAESITVIPTPIPTTWSRQKTGSLLLLHAHRPKL